MGHFEVFRPAEATWYQWEQNLVSFTTLNCVFSVSINQSIVYYRLIASRVCGNVVEGCSIRLLAVRDAVASL